jgi:hypothetical protein
MEFLVFAVLIGLIPAMVARSKGRDFVPWWIYGSLLFIVALPHALLLKPELKQVEQQQAAQGLKKCPFCAEMIKPDAKVCRYCSRDLPPPDPLEPAPPAAKPKTTWGDPNPSAYTGPSWGAKKEPEQQREKLRTQLEEFRKQQPPRDG